MRRKYIRLCVTQNSERTKSLYRTRENQGTLLTLKKATMDYDFSVSAQSLLLRPMFSKVVNTAQWMTGKILESRNSLSIAGGAGEVTFFLLH